MDRLAEVIKAMGDYAATATSDLAAIEVSAVLNRLVNQGGVCEKPLTRRELAVIQPFYDTVFEAERVAKQATIDRIVGRV